LVRARCNQLVALPNDIALSIVNLPSGYHRDMQLLKEILFPAIQSLKDCLAMIHLMLSNITVKENILNDDKYRFLFSVEEVNKLVLEGVPFRDAYKKVGMDIEHGTYAPGTSVSHTHEGSIGNLSLEQINKNMIETIDSFQFAEYQNALSNLLKE